MTRNKVKRWLREATRRQAGQIEGVHDVVIIAHPSSASAKLSTLNDELAICFSQIGARR